eukprot:TRINITY_DN9040_c0_g1_i6.p1 TRINITY_DN9040_c0_g1~~TRINITY_DN9040_c0_g1_i6.p1  ORF type:complete len:211 (+),score=34.51 TRINITY_DN9040_c0_g1_i6:278-910(+)
MHRLSLLGADTTEQMNRELEALALDSEEMQRETARPASNIGGFHSEVDLWSWPAFRSTPAADLLWEAVRQVECYEAAAHHRQAVAFEDTPEAWLNVSRADHWNHLHTHPGATYSGAYFVSGGGCVDADAESLSGRLVMVPGAVRQLPDHHRQLHLEESSAGVADAAKDCSTAVLVVDPVPGSFIVFPAFVPHFVLPAPEQSNGKPRNESI